MDDVVAGAARDVVVAGGAVDHVVAVAPGDVVADRADRAVFDRLGRLADRRAVVEAEHRHVDARPAGGAGLGRDAGRDLGGRGARQLGGARRGRRRDGGLRGQRADRDRIERRLLAEAAPASDPPLPASGAGGSWAAWPELAGSPA